MNTIIIALISCLILLAYLFDITASKTKIPTVILLMGLGFGLHLAANELQIYTPYLATLLPILGTVGLILIVLEGSLDLEFEKEKIPLIKKSFILALSSILGLGVLFTVGICTLSNISLNDAILNALPLTIISSAIAIPSARHLPKWQKETVTYESSLSDIIGILFFNMFLSNSSINTSTIFEFVFQLILMLALSLFATLLLTYLLSKIKFHVKYVPIIFSILLIYSIAKWYHLPSLVFVLIFGMILRNLDKIKFLNYFKHKQLDMFEIEIKSFHELVIEGTFIVRACFFILFGFLLETKEILNIHTLPYAIFAILLIFTIRYLILRMLKIARYPLVFIAPRGLITVLLFISIPVSRLSSAINNSLIVQIILLSALMLTLGNIISKNKKNDTADETEVKEIAIH
jgi:hypothetical protein